MNVVVYSKNNCVQCKMAKRWLLENEVEFKEVNIDEDHDGLKKLLTLGLSSLPVVQFNKGSQEQYIVGFAPNKLTEMKEG